MFLDHNPTNKKKRKNCVGSVNVLHSFPTRPKKISDYWGALKSNIKAAPSWCAEVLGQSWCFCNSFTPSLWGLRVLSAGTWSPRPDLMLSFMLKYSYKNTNGPMSPNLVKLQCLSWLHIVCVCVCSCLGCSLPSNINYLENNLWLSVFLNSPNALLLQY